MHPLEAFLFAVFLIVFFGSIAVGVFSVIRDAFSSGRMKRLQVIQERWRDIDLDLRGKYVLQQQVGIRPPEPHWRAQSMSWVMGQNGWKGWGRSWVDDN